jgi:hypothetical protein
VLRVTSNRRSPPFDGQQPVGTPRGLSTNTGPIASAAWLVARELYPREPKWSVEIALAPAGSIPSHEIDEHATCFQIGIYAEEWGFLFSHASRVSWIRITDLPFVHGRDEHKLLSATPPLRQIGNLIHDLEKRHQIRFDREGASVKTELHGSEGVIRRWIATL